MNELWIVILLAYPAYLLFKWADLSSQADTRRAKEAERVEGLERDHRRLKNDADQRQADADREFWANVRDRAQAPRAED